MRASGSKTLLIAVAALMAALSMATPPGSAAGHLKSAAACPGNIDSLPLHTINGHQMILAISINHAGPYDFLLDTGTQMTMIDPALATELRLENKGTAEVASVSVHASASFAQLDLLQAGTHAVANQRVLVYDLQNLQATGLTVRGVLGEDFLERFDMLIDNVHKVLCLDDSAVLRADVKGQHIALMAPALATNGADLPSSLIVEARFSDGMRTIRLKLDSGSNASFLYNPSECLALGLFRSASLQGGGAGRAQRIFTALPPQGVKIGTVELSKVPFITLVGARKNARTSEFDGLLELGLFKRVLIDHADHFAVLEPW